MYELKFSSIERTVLKHYKARLLDITLDRKSDLEYKFREYSNSIFLLLDGVGSSRDRALVQEKLGLEISSTAVTESFQRLITYRHKETGRTVEEVLNDFKTQIKNIEDTKKLLDSGKIVFYNKEAVSKLITEFNYNPPSTKFKGYKNLDKKLKGKTDLMVANLKEIINNKGIPEHEQLIVA